MFVQVQKARRPFFQKGDKPGHPFRGNQWTRGGKNVNAPKQTAKEYVNSLSQKDKQIVMGYCEAGFIPMNKILRGAPPPPVGPLEETVIEPQINSMTKILSDCPPSTEEITLYRGVSGEIADSLIKAPVGSVFRDDGIVSTSEDQLTAALFTSSGNYEASAVMTIVAPIGTKRLPVSSISPKPNELEHILSPGTRFRIVGHRPQVLDSNRTEILVEVVK